MIAIRAGRLVDVERGEVRRDQLILIQGERITAVQPGSTRPPAGARVIDLSRYSVLPGLIDCHSHLIGDLTGADALLPLQRSAAQEAFSGVRNARSTLLAGFTTVRDVGTYRALVDAALRDAINDGTVIGPRMAVAGAYVTVTRRRGELVGTALDVPIPPEYRFGVANGVDEVRERVRAILNGGADFIKIIATGAVLTRGTKPGAPEYTEEEIRAAVEEAADVGHLRGGPRPRRRGHQARGPGGGALDRARLADGRRGDRADEARRARSWWPTSTTATISPSEGGRGGWPRRRSGRTTRPPRPSGRASRRRWRPA